MPRTANRQREVETMHTQNLKLRTALRNLCVRTLEYVHAPQPNIDLECDVEMRKLATDGLALLDEPTIPADAIYSSLTAKDKS